MLSQNFDASKNSLIIRNRSRGPDTRNPPSTPQPEMLARRRVVKTGGGTLVTYPTFRTSASLSHGSPYLPLNPPIRTPRPPKPTKPHAPPSASRPLHRVVHRQRRPPQPTCLIDTEFHCIRCASLTPSPSSPGLLHRAHRRTSAPRGHWGFTNGLVHRIVALRCHSRSASVRGQPTPAHHPQRL